MRGIARCRFQRAHGNEFNLSVIFCESALRMTQGRESAVFFEVQFQRRSKQIPLEFADRVISTIYDPNVGSIEGNAQRI
jgi:hypothetical protein